VLRDTLIELHPEADNAAIQHFEQLALFFVFN
jgi:hypothetical protein